MVKVDVEEGEAGWYSSSHRMCTADAVASNQSLVHCCSPGSPYEEPPLCYVILSMGL